MTTRLLSHQVPGYVKTTLGYLPTPPRSFECIPMSVDQFSREIAEWIKTTDYLPHEKGMYILTTKVSGAEEFVKENKDWVLLSRLFEEIPAAASLRCFIDNEPTMDENSISFEMLNAMDSLLEAIVQAGIWCIGVEHGIFVPTCLVIPPVQTLVKLYLDMKLDIPETIFDEHNELVQRASEMNIAVYTTLKIAVDAITPRTTRMRSFSLRLKKKLPISPANSFRLRRASRSDSSMRDARNKANSASEPIPLTSSQSTPNLLYDA